MNEERQWWCVPDFSRSARKRRGLKKSPPPYRSNRLDHYIDSNRDHMDSSHSDCGYRGKRGKIIPWRTDPRNPDAQ